MTERKPQGMDADRRSDDSRPAVDPGDAAPHGVPGVSGSGGGHDPGDAVPPGVAPLDSPEPTEEDRRVLEKLRDLPRRSRPG